MVVATHCLGWRRPRLPEGRGVRVENSFSVPSISLVVIGAPGFYPVVLGDSAGLFNRKSQSSLSNQHPLKSVTIAAVPLPSVANISMRARPF